MHKWVAILVLAMLSLCTAGCGQPREDDQQLVERARDYMDSSKFNAAVIELRNALQINPGNSEARYLLGTIMLELGDYATSEKEFRRALETGWKGEDAITGLAHALLGQVNYTGLLDDIKINPVWPESVRANLLGMRAIALAGLGQTEQAGIAVAEASTLDAEALQVLQADALLKLAAHEIAAASEVLTVATGLYPNARDLQLLAAKVDRIKGEDAHAREIYLRIIAADPPGFVSIYGRKAQFELLELQILGGDIDKAKKLLSALYKSRPNDPYVNFLGGLLAFMQGDYEQSEGRLLKVLKLAPDHNPTRLMYGVVNYAQRDYEQAAYFLSKYIVAVPENLDARKLLVRSYLALERHEDALEASEDGLSEGGKDAELVALAGLSAIRKGEMIAGIAELEKAVSMAPNNLEVRGALARTYISAGETGLAVRELHEILDKGGDLKQTEAMMVLAHLRAGEVDQAGIVAFGMLSRDKENPAIITLVGYVYAASDDRGSAREYLEKALRIKPGFPMAALALARIEELEGNTPKAIALYEDLVDSAPKPEVPMQALARLAEQQGRIQDMVEWLNKAIQHSPGVIEPRILLARYYMSQNQYDKVRSLVTDTLMLSPNAADLLVLQARLLMVDRHFAEALSLLSSLVSRDPGVDDTRLLRGECLFQLGRLEEARSDLDIILKKQPKNLAVLVLISKLEIQEGEFFKALGYGAQLQRNFPEHSIGYELTGDIRFAQKDYEGATSDYEQALSRKSTPELAVKLAESSFRAGNSEKAIIQLHEILSKAPENVAAKLMLGTLYLKMGENGKAAEAYKGVLAFDQKNKAAMNNLAWLYMQAQNPEALEMAKRAYQFYPDDPSISDTYGWLLVQHGHASRGRPLLKQAMEKLSDVPEVRFHYAMALYKTGDKAAGLRILQLLLNSDISFEGMDEAKRILVAEK